MSFETVVEQMNTTWKTDIEKLEEKIISYDKDLKTELKTPIDMLANKLKLTIRQMANKDRACTTRIDKLEKMLETVHQN